VPDVLSDTTVLQLVEHIYAAGCDPREWQRAVEEVHAQLPGVAFSTHLDIHDTPLTGHVAGIAPEHVESYLAHYHAQNPYTGIFMRMKEGRIYTSTDLGTRAWLGEHAFFHEWLKPAGNFTHGASVVLARDGRRLMRVTLDIPDRHGDMEKTCALLLQRLGPHLTRAFELNERLQAKVATESALHGMLDRMDGAAAILGAGARVFVLNDQAEEMARAGRPFKISPAGRLIFQHPETEAGFRQALAVALGSLLDGSPFAFTAPAGISVVVLPLRPLTSCAASPMAPPKALLVARQAGAAAALPRDLLKRLYRLTNAEIEVVLQIATGVSVADAADALGVTRTTARNQLAVAMAKMGVHRQGELVAVVTGLAPRLRLESER
jgi:DNA-binding CsgD family transcriptional regulator